METVCRETLVEIKPFNTALERSRAMREPQKNQVNRCFGKGLVKSGKPKALPPTERQKEEEVKRILLALAEKRRADAKEKELSKMLKNLLLQYKGRYSILQLLPLIKRRSPGLLAVAIKRVEGQRNRNELSIEKIVEFETFKACLLKQEE